LEAVGDIRSALSEMNGYELDGQTLEVSPLLDSPKKSSDRGSEKSSRCVKKSMINKNARIR